MIKIDNVSFEYDHREVFSNITFSINPGERVGLVGPNGVGRYLHRLDRGQSSEE